MRRRPLNCRCACPCQRVRLSTVAPVNCHCTVRAASQHRRCAPILEMDIDSGLSVVGDVHSANFDTTTHSFYIVKRPVPALTDKPAMRRQRRQSGQCCGFGDGVRVQHCSVVVDEVDILRPDWFSAARVHRACDHRAGFIVSGVSRGELVCGDGIRGEVDYRLSVYHNLVDRHIKLPLLR